MSCVEPHPAVPAPVLPLWEIASQGRYQRLVARPGWVFGERLEGASVLDIPWSLAQHTACCNLLHTPMSLAEGGAVLQVADAIVLTLPPSGAWRIEDLIHEGRMPSHVGRLLSAVVHVGCNVVITGAWIGGIQLVARLLNEAHKPAFLALPHDAIPPRWLRISQICEALTYGPDRVGTWSLTPDVLLQALGRLSGVVAWMDAPRVQRAINRLQAASEGLPASQHAVLAGVDFVVASAWNPATGLHLQTVAEITDRPSKDPSRVSYQTLWQAQQDAGLSGASRVMAPSCVDALVAGGFGRLVDMLEPSPLPRGITSSSTGARRTQEEGFASLSNHRPVDHLPAGQLADGAPDPFIQAPSQAADQASYAASALGSALGSAPGWELDRLTPQEDPDRIFALSEQDTEPEDPISATLGLGPPPRP